MIVSTYSPSLPFFFFFLETFFLFYSKEIFLEVNNGCFAILEAKVAELKLKDSQQTREPMRDEELSGGSFPVSLGTKGA